MNDPGRPTTADYVAQIRSDARRIAEVASTGPGDAPVEACPDWTLSDLIGHLGSVHRWATHTVSHGERPPAGSGGGHGGQGGAGLGGWLLDGADGLTRALEATAPDAPVWNPFGAPPVAALWPRRQAHETMVHRWDAEHAIGATTPLPAEMASDGIDELFEIMIPSNVARGSVTLPPESLHVHCTDVHGEWLVWVEDGQLRMRREHAKGAAAVRGPAESLLLLFWGRTHVLDPAIEVIGDVDVAARWSRLTS